MDHNLQLKIIMMLNTWQEMLKMNMRNGDYVKVNVCIGEEVKYIDSF